LLQDGLLASLSWSSVSVLGRFRATGESENFLLEDVNRLGDAVSDTSGVLSWRTEAPPLRLRAVSTSIFKLELGMLAIVVGNAGNSFEALFMPFRRILSSPEEAGCASSYLLSSAYQGGGMLT
jgi:hypothetical protein